MHATFVHRVILPIILALVENHIAFMFHLCDSWQFSPFNECTVTIMHDVSVGEVILPVSHGVFLFFVEIQHPSCFVYLIYSIHWQLPDYVIALCCIHRYSLSNGT